MKAHVENDSPEKKSSKASSKRASMELSANQLRLFKAALTGTKAEEPSGVLAGHQ